MRIVSAPLNLQCVRGFEEVWENCEVVSEGRLEESCRLKDEKAVKRAELAVLRRSKSVDSRADPESGPGVRRPSELQSLGLLCCEGRS